MVDVEILIVAMNSLRLASRPNLHRQAGVQDGMAGVCVLSSAIVVTCCLVNKHRKKLGD